MVKTTQDFISYVLDENASESNGSIALDVDRDKRIHVVFEDAGDLWYTSKSPSQGSWRPSVSTDLQFDGDVAIGGEGQQLDGQSTAVFAFTSRTVKRMQMAICLPSMPI